MHQWLKLIDKENAELRLTVKDIAKLKNNKITSISIISVKIVFI